ncbi:MAG: excinuclease family protein [Verrucomicrobia bacterium]|jgi:excinuclease ABC subunit A|nr:excinuclease family protein [Verrucomicrobiota bacterium]
MSKATSRPVIRLRGVRHNNLKNFDLDLPTGELVVITGLSGSGKSSLAFDTLFAEGQRRYIETFSPYARQFFDRMDKPQVDSIEGIPPAIAIEQRNSVKSTRSTVGTMTEICDHMKVLWPHLAQLHCRQCDQFVRKDSAQDVWERARGEVSGAKEDPEKVEVLVTFTVALSEKLPLEESLKLIAKQGYQRLLVGDKVVRLEEVLKDSLLAPQTSHLIVVQDRIKLAKANRSRFVEACEQAYHFGKGKLALYRVEQLGGAPSSAVVGQAPSPVQPELAPWRRYSKHLHCATCDIEYRDPSPALFSFNNPVGACPACRGFGRVISIDYDLAIPDRSKTLAGGAVKPWQGGVSADCQVDLVKACRKHKVPMDVPFEDLSPKHQSFVVDGEANYGIDTEHEWPHLWYGVKGYFRWLESKSYKMHVRVLLSRYRAYTKCRTCDGKRFQPEALLYRFTKDSLRFAKGSVAADEVTDKAASSFVSRKPSITLADFYLLPIRDALALVEAFAASRKVPVNDPIKIVVDEVRARLGYLHEVGLGYLTLDRPTRSLSGGETERVNLTTCLGTRLVNTLFVLDEPSVGLHPRDTERLVKILERLRDTGNTVVVVEHEAGVMRAANQLIDIGPGHGESGGEIVFQGPFAEILKSERSLTGQYLSGRRKIEVPVRRHVSLGHGNELKDLSIAYRTGVGEQAPKTVAYRRIEPEIVPTDLPAHPMLHLTGANLHNLENVSVEIPLGRLVCITGVSGSGKSTLIREVLLPALTQKFAGAVKVKGEDESEDDDENEGGFVAAKVTGWEHVGGVVMVDQSTLGKTPRSNPAVYIGAFDDIREVFAQAELAKQRGLGSSAFSFNSSQGQCERCRGAGFEKIEMQFLSDVFIRCPDCQGRRYRPHILEVKVQSARRASADSNELIVTEWSIGDFLEATVDDAVAFLAELPDYRPAQRACASLRLLQDVGLGYLRVGQPINTLSGGESQRLKLVRHLAEWNVSAQATGGKLNVKPTLFLFDEPTTGLHFEDVRVLLLVFQRMVEQGHSVLVIEHNLDVIKCADWVIDLGPDAGDQGGHIVAMGTPEEVAMVEASHTGRALRPMLGSAKFKAQSSKLKL